MTLIARISAAFLLVLLSADAVALADDAIVSLPAGVKAVWDIDKAHRETTATRERISINGLWRWQPARGEPDQVPDGRWGYFKVPGCWPGITDYMQKDCQTVFSHPSWKDDRLGATSSAWYQREITVPAAWEGRRVVLAAEYLNSYATVFVDGKKGGDLRFPGGELDLSPFCRPGKTHSLSLFVVALPLKGVMLSYTDTNTAREVKGQVARRGLCGDVYLSGVPAGPSIADVKVDPSVRKMELGFDVALGRLVADTSYALRARVTGDGNVVREFTSPIFKGNQIIDGRLAFAANWLADRLWDIHTPRNQFEVTVSLLTSTGTVLDTALAVRFGFRDFWIDGRDFYLNGSRLFLSAVPLDNAQIGAAWASYAGARESLERLKSIGINYVYTHNYGCEPGSHLSFAEILQAADDVGMLVGFSQPHFSHYDWQQPNADLDNGYARHAEFYVRQARNHPSVVFYATSHNATGYDEDMNPEMIDGVSDPRGPAEKNYVSRALRAEAILKRLDPGRIVYHHSSGNLGAMHTSNFYPNFAPIQELSDWFEHWATTGVKPIFTCEFGAPFSWDWAMYRGWYRGERSFGSARVPWDFCLAEWNSQFLGDAAFPASEAEMANLRWEAKKFRAGELWNRWDYPQSLNSKRFDERYPVMARYLTDNWRSFRTWGVSAISPWEHEQYWKLRDGVDRERKELPVDWERLQRPGLSPDYLAQRYERMDLAFERTDWQPTEAARSLLRNNLPLLGWIAGKPAAFTSKDHIFVPGETVEKQAIVINNSRETVVCDCSWSIEFPQAVAGDRQVTVATGDQVRIPLQFRLPESLPPGEYRLNVRFRFATGETQDDDFVMQVVPPPPVVQSKARIALFDSRGETGKWLTTTGIQYRSIDAGTDLSAYDVLIVGKAALTLDSPAPDIAHVRSGLRVVVFEQAAEVLEKRLGFRVAEYGLREVFRRVPDHPLITGTADDEWRDWRGAATLNPPRLKYERRPRLGPTVQWCGLTVPRVWRCGNRGNVASVLIEKPARGDFLPLLDGGYSLQYSPLMEFHEGDGMMLFCQMDVTGRTESEPTAERLARRIVEYASTWRPFQRRKAVYVGDAAGKAHFEAAGIPLVPYRRGELADDHVLVVGRGGGESLADDAAAISNWLKAGGHLLVIGLDQAETNSLSLGVALKNREHISASFPLFGGKSPLAGVGPSDVHNRDPRDLPLVTSGATIFGDGVLAASENGNIVFCQLVPWQFGGSRQPNLRKTFRRSSFLVTRLLGEMGVAGTTPIVSRFHTPVDATRSESRWQEGLYLDQPEEWDDPYRFFRW
jgi:hypothetical protein